MKRWWKPTAHWRTPWRSVRAGSSAPYQRSSTTSWHAARVVLAAVEQRHRRVEPTTSRRRRRRILVLVVGRRALASRREEAAAAAEVGVAGPAASAAVQAVYVQRRGTGGAQLSRWWSQTGRERRRGRGHHGGGGGREAGVDARRRAGHGDGMQGSLGASRRVLSCRVWPPYHWLAAESAKYLASRAVFLFLYFLFSFFTKIYFRFGNLQEYIPAALLPGTAGRQGHF